MDLIKLQQILKKAKENPNYAKDLEQKSMLFRIKEYKQAFKGILELSKTPDLVDMSGQYGLTYSVGKDFFVKIARTESERIKLKKESVLSQFLQGKLPVKTPKIILQEVILPNLESGEEQLYLCGFSNRLKGSVYHLRVSRRDVDSYFVARQIGEVMTALHGIDEADVPSQVPTLESFLLNTLKNNCKSVPEMTIRQSLLSKLTAIPDVSQKPVLCHADWNWGNLVINPKNDKLVGVLDFGVAYKGPYITDVNNALHHHKEDVMDTYHQPTVGPIPLVLGYSSRSLFLSVHDEIKTKARA